MAPRANGLRLLNVGVTPLRGKTGRTGPCGLRRTVKSPAKTDFLSQARAAPPSAKVLILVRATVPYFGFMRLGWRATETASDLRRGCLAVAGQTLRARGDPSYCRSALSSQTVK